MRLLLLEREAALDALERAWRAVRDGTGQVALVGGEAGVGKSALAGRLVGDRSTGDGAAVLWGACDALFTPRPLGPLHDMAAGAPALAAALANHTDRAAVFAAVLDTLRARPTIAVFEDVHWADEATLDLLRYLGRRITQTRALLVATYRDDELGPGHPLRAVLGDLVSPAVLRLTLSPLSEAAVAVLAGNSGLDPVALHQQTGGNAFFVTEVLAAAGGLPPTVRDAVLARAARLSPAARALLEAAAVVGLRAEPDVLPAVAEAAGPPGVMAALEECLAGGMLLAQGNAVTFRHDLSREAILAAISPPRAARLHAAALAALAGTPEAGANPARLAHHAAAAGDGAAVRRYAAAAARQSAAAGAHRAAADHYERALRHAGDLPPAELAPLLDAYARECNLVDRRAEGAEVCRRAAALWRQLGEPVREGYALATLANMSIGVGRGAAAERTLAEAIALLEAHPPGPELAFAYRMRAAVAFLDHDYRPSIAWAEMSIGVAEAVGETGAVLSARNLIGSALLFLDYARGCDYLEDNQARAAAAGRTSIVGHAYANLGSAACELYQLDRAERYLGEGIPYAIEHDLDRYRFYMTAWL
ncbi:MAG TPA: AAA family ATPase, partial [Promineifilum sp.]|nr:AAA family ATPase [Promineifilum sp.]